MPTLFKPEDGQNVLTQYSELRDYPEFEKIKSKELRFVWEYCNSKELKPSQKAYNAYIAVYGETKDKIQSDFVNGNFSYHIKAAIRVMEKFSLPHRVRAKAMAEKMFENIEKEVAKAGDDMDVTKYKQYSELLPSLLKQIEQGFGIRDAEEKRDDKKAPTFADGILSEMADN